MRRHDAKANADDGRRRLARVTSGMCVLGPPLWREAGLASAPTEKVGLLLVAAKMMWRKAARAAMSCRQSVVPPPPLLDQPCTAFRLKACGAVNSDHAMSWPPVAEDTPGAEGVA
jgi:hypothetical protein